MKGKQIITALVVLVLLSVYLYFGEIKKRQNKETEKNKKETIYQDLKKEDVSEIVIQTIENKIIIKKISNDWMIIEPIQSYADESTVGSILERHAAAKSERIIEQVNLADYNLDKPEVYIEFVTKDKTYRLNMAGYNPIGDSAYAAIPGNTTTVYLVPKNLRLDCDKELKDLRYKGLMKFTDDAVTEMVINLNDRDKKYRLKKQDGWWHIVSPVSKTAKNERIMTYLSYMKNTGIKDFMDVKDAERYGLSNPLEYIEVYEGKDVQRAYFGKENKSKNSRYAKSTIHKNLLEIPDYVYNGIEKIDEITNKQLFLFMQDKVEKISVKYGDKSIVAVKHHDKSGTEKWEYSEFKNIDNKKKESIYIFGVASNLYWLEYKSVIEKFDQKDEAEKYGLIPGLAEIKLYGKNDELFGTVILGGKVEGKEEIYVKVPEKNMIYTIDANYVKNIGLPDLEIK
ncbi:MAG: DUF4340 domain-containing protein [Candidatus Goldbacteria bacterium]|nr:DUF4340 domain-containing protein [Candidatus Goldiibacteriota bacterium]